MNLKNFEESLRNDVLKFIILLNRSEDLNRNDLNNINHSFCDILDWRLLFRREIAAASNI